MKCRRNLASSCIEDSGEMTLERFYLHLRSLIDRTEALQPSGIPLHASPSRWLITLISKFNGLSNMRVYLSQALRRWEPKVLFLKCGSWRIACNSTPSPPAQGYRRGKEWGTGVVLIGVCSDDIFSQRVAKKFHSSLPQQDPWLHWYYSWRK